jgi:GMP synthase (glutamine-hydrolysing)
MTKRQFVLILDFGGQYNHHRPSGRECRVYCEVKPYTTPLKPSGRWSPSASSSPAARQRLRGGLSPGGPAIFELGVPILGICYGCQLLAHNLGGQVTPAQDDSAREYGKTETWYDTSCPLFAGLPAEGVSWMSHGDYMARVRRAFSLPPAPRPAPMWPSRTYPGASTASSSTPR